MCVSNACTRADVCLPEELFEPYKAPPPEEVCYVDGERDIFELDTSSAPHVPRQTVPRPTEFNPSSGVLADISNIDKVSTGARRSRISNRAQKFLRV